MKAFFKKLTSRKFLTAAAGVVMGLALALGADADTVATVSGAVTTLGSVLAYIITEGRVDIAKK